VKPITDSVGKSNGLLAVNTSRYIQKWIQAGCSEFESGFR